MSELLENISQGSINFDQFIRAVAIIGHGTIGESSVINCVIRPPQDVDVLAAQDFEIPCSRPDISGFHPKLLLIINVGYDEN